MPVRMLNFIQQPPPAQKFTGKITKTEEYQDFILSCGSGLKPHEYITINFPDTHPVRKIVRHPEGAFLAAAKKKIKELQLPYDVYCREKVIYIVGRGVIS
jgi:hypothetical protein